MRPIWLGFVFPIAVAGMMVSWHPGLAGDSAPTDGELLFEERFDLPDGLVTNEYETWISNDSGSHNSSVWTMTSGSLFARTGRAWTGVPDGRSPDPASLNSTDSAVFRLTTRRSDFSDFKVEFDVRAIDLTTTPRTPPTDWDGIHVFLRYESETSLYYASVLRRDNQVVAKKKVPGGTSNGGTYHTLANDTGSVPLDRAWHHVEVSVRTTSDGSVRIAIAIDGRTALEAIDTSAEDHRRPSFGAVGLRGDNCEFEFDDFLVRALSGDGG